MRGNSVKAELSRPIGKGGSRAGVVPVRRVPVQNGIDVIEKSRTNHINFPRTALFCRGPIEADDTRLPRCFHPFLYGYGSSHRSCSKKMMAAGVPRSILDQWFSMGNRILRQSRKCVELRQDPNDGFAMTITCHEGCRNLCHAFFY